MIHNSAFITTKNEEGINGWMVPFAKTLDDFWKDYDIKYIYSTSVNAGCKKGPILHLKRECRLFPAYGCCKLVVKEESEYKEYDLDYNKPYVISIEAGKPFCILNDTKEICLLINVANHCWSIDDQDSHPVLDWNYHVK